MEISKYKKVIFPILALILTLSAAFSPQASAEETNKGISQKEAEIIQKSLKFDPQNKKYIFDKDIATSEGLTQNQATNLKNFFENMKSDEIKQFNEKVGFKPDYETKQQTRIAPALLAVLAFIGGAAAGKLLDEIMNYGIAKACQSNKGKWGAFDDYCSTNGHI